MADGGMSAIDSEGSSRRPAKKRSREERDRSTSSRSRSGSDRASDRGESSARSVSSLTHPTPGPSSLPTPVPPNLADPNQFAVLHSMLQEIKANLPPQFTSTTESLYNFSGFSGDQRQGDHNMSSSDDDLLGDVQVPTSRSNALDKLDLLTSGQPDGVAASAASPDAEAPDAEFQQALDDLAGFFRATEEAGEPLIQDLADILNKGLRQRPEDDEVKETAAKYKLPANVANIKVPVTNSDVIKAMNANGKFLDARLTRTNGLLSRAMVPLARIVSDVGERKVKPMAHYVPGINDSLRLLAAGFNYLNHLRKEVVRISVNDTALGQLCRWEEDDGQEEGQKHDERLFPFDVSKKCEEIHKAKTLGRPKFPTARRSGYNNRGFGRGRPVYRGGRSNKPAQPVFKPYRPSKPPGASAPFLGQRQPRGRREKATRGTHW